MRPSLPAHRRQRRWRDGVRGAHRIGRRRIYPSGIDFDWNGADEGDQVTGTGWADLRDDGWLKGEIAYDNGDDTSFIAQPWPFSTAKAIG